MGSRVRRNSYPHGTMEVTSVLVSIDALDYVRGLQDNQQAKHALGWRWDANAQPGAGLRTDLMARILVSDHWNGSCEPDIKYLRQKHS